MIVCYSETEISKRQDTTETISFSWNKIRIKFGIRLLPLNKQMQSKYLEIFTE